ncbi:MAG UNVERIFIED_CONTAM: hypothetical protein LVR18_00685 [Planctomycetaceae bacterium]
MHCGIERIGKSDQDDQNLIDSYGHLRGPLNELRVLEVQVPRLEQEVKELKDAVREWPQAEATVEAWESTKTGLYVRIERLKKELASARKRETAAGVVKSYQGILAAQQAFNDANKKVEEHSCPDADTVSEIVGLNRSIESGESKLNARTLAWRVEATELETIRVTRGLGAAELIEVNTDGVQGTAAGRLQVELGGLRLTVDGGDDNVDAIIEELGQCRAPSGPVTHCVRRRNG